MLLVAVLVLAVAGAGWSFAADYVGQPGAAEDRTVATAPGGGTPAAGAAGVDGQRHRKRDRQRDHAKDRKREQTGALAATWSVTSVVDGDTIVVARGDAEEHVRLIGIDTPERGACGYSEATVALGGVLDREVELSPGATSDRDRYGRLLRYVDVDGVDAGLAMIKGGLAVARYDSRDGYGRHPREDAYVTADAGTANVCDVAEVEPQRLVGSAEGPASGLAEGAVWPGCNEARAAGAAPVYRDDPGYAAHLDGDGDGIGCE